MAKAVRMADIAEKMSVSTVTVSKALAGKKGVSETLRVQILQTAKDMGYQQKSSDADSSSSFSGKTIGILNSARFLEKGHSFYWNLYERVLAQLSDQDNFAMLEVVSLEDEAQCVAPRLLTDGKVDGMIVVGMFSTAYKEMLARFSIPFVVLDAYDAREPWDAVISDSYYGMYTMTQYLITHGHRDIVFAGTVGSTSSITDRYFGYCRAMMEAGLTVDESCVLPDRDEKGYVNVGAEVLKRPLPTAFACNCDTAAYYILNSLKDSGVRIPQDVSIVGFDDFVLSQMSIPAITTYAVDLDSMAKVSIRQLFRRMERPDALRQIAVVSGKLVERDSVCAPRALEPALIR